MEVGKPRSVDRSVESRSSLLLEVSQVDFEFFRNVGMAGVRVDRLWSWIRLLLHVLVLLKSRWDLVAVRGLHLVDLRVHVELSLGHVWGFLVQCDFVRVGVLRLCPLLRVRILDRVTFLVQTLTVRAGR